MPANPPLARASRAFLSAYHETRFDADALHRYTYDRKFLEKMRREPVEFGFGEFGKVVYYRTYSRIKPDGGQEHWVDTVERVCSGTMTILKTHFVQNNLEWDDAYWDSFARDLMQAMVRMEFLPAGRGLWAQGTECVFERGTGCLYNCAATSTRDFVGAVDWTMDMLMMGCGVGYLLDWEGDVASPHPFIDVCAPVGRAWRAVPIQVKRYGLETLEETLYVDDAECARYVIPDTREGWVHATRLLLEAFIPNVDGKLGAFPDLDYSQIRKAGEPLRTFGGTASGPGPLMKFHQRLLYTLAKRMRGEFSRQRVVADVMNACGACVVAGNVRRSSLICVGSIYDEEFVHLKNYDRNPDRIDIGGMSNNSVKLQTKQDFLEIPNLLQRIAREGEPGLLNMINVRKYGRYTDERADEDAVCANPCGEIPLADKEVCNLSEVFPIKFLRKDGTFDVSRFHKVLRLATVYCQAVSLYPTHRPETNAIIEKNRRIGVSLSGVADLLDRVGGIQLARIASDGYHRVRQVNREFAYMAHIAESNRVTTVKPAGTTSQLVGVSSGMHFPLFQYAVRRIRMAEDSPVARVLKEQMAWERDRYSDRTIIFQFPINQGETRPSFQVSLWEQFSLLAMLQRRWSDNMVSCSIYFDAQKDLKELEQCLGMFVPLIKSVSLFPRTNVVSRWVVACRRARVAPLIDQLQKYLTECSFHTMTNMQDQMVMELHFHGEHAGVVRKLLMDDETVAVLEQSEGAYYPQAPYEEITREQYHELLKELPRVDWTKFGGSNGIEERYCTSDHCTL